jgi:dTDP-4-amino-4,6-dideoxygalactose transaminase
MPEAAYGRSNCWLTCLTVDPSLAGVSRDDIRLALEAENIESRPLWKPMHLQPAFNACPMAGGAVAAGLFDRGLCLPSGSSLPPASQARVIDIVKSRHAGSPNRARVAARAWPAPISSTTPRHL